jgi:hypothetical protein
MCLRRLALNKNDIHKMIGVVFMSFTSGIQVIVVDSGRFGVKAEEIKTSGVTVREFFPAVVAPAHDFKLNVNTDISDHYWIRSSNQEYFIGKFALAQSKNVLLDRTRDKGNLQNHLLVLNAVSLFAEPNAKVVLLTNCPARDWSSQVKKLSDTFKGAYSITHKAGKRKGMTVNFEIVQVHPLPEGCGAFYGFTFDNDLKVREPEFHDGGCLVLEIGDETVNYITMRDGDYIDDDCGSLDLGLRVPHSAVQKWLEGLGKEITLVELSQSIVSGKPIYIGDRLVDIQGQLRTQYQNLADTVFIKMQERIRLSDIRNVLLAGGGANALYQCLKEKFFGLSRVTCLPDNEGQWLNARGFRIMYELMRNDE